jgi:hypothetical protein
VIFVGKKARIQERAIMVGFDGYKGPFWEDTRTDPVFLATTRFRHNNWPRLRTHPIPFEGSLRYHKPQSQGITLREGYTKHWKKKDFPPGLSYVGTSKVTSKGYDHVRDNLTMKGFIVRYIRTES